MLMVQDALRQVAEALGMSRWKRYPRPATPEQWRLTGRPFDPRQRKPSEGEQRHGAADRLLWAASGVLGALAGLWLGWSVFFGR